MLAYIRLRLSGFSHCRLPMSRFLTVFPFRMITLASLKTTPSSTLSYWCKPHTSTTRKPIVFVHGIGVGIWSYASFLAEINKTQRDYSEGQIGIIAIEVMPISSRITGEIPTQETLCEEIMEIVNKHGWENFELVSNSYGTVIARNLYRRVQNSGRISSMVLIDPVPFLLHLPDVCYNFMRRSPRKANEHQLYYFASTDIAVANTLGRHFFWTDNILWKEDIRDCKVTVALSGRDLIVNTQAVGKYLAEDEPGYERFLTEDESGSGEIDAWKESSWKGEGLDILWFEDVDHAQVFEKARHYRRLVEVVRSYSADT